MLLRRKQLGVNVVVIIANVPELIHLLYSWLTRSAFNQVDLFLWMNFEITQDKILRRKRLSTGTNFVHVYIEIRDKGILKFNEFSI